MSCVLFDNYSNVVFDRVDIGNAPEMTRKDYVPGGSTALIYLAANIDAVKTGAVIGIQEEVPASPLS